MNTIDLIDAVPLSILMLIAAMILGTGILLGEELIRAINRLRDWIAWRRRIHRTRIANMGYLEFCEWHNRRRARLQIYFGLACLILFWGLIVTIRAVFGHFWPS